jgi:hypothetical protein
MPKLGFTVSLSASDDGRLHADISPSDEERFAMTRAVLVLCVWRESNEIVRCSLQHPATGSIAYMQGNRELIELSDVLKLELMP